jgi:putative glutamine amidotransferase
MKQIIGIVSTPFKKTKKVNEGYEGQPTRTRLTYENAVIKAGGIPIVLNALTNKEDIKRQLDLVDGLLMQGGSNGDIELMHIEYIKQAYEKNMPILGICMGMQLLNVALGGELGKITTKVNHKQPTPLYMSFHKVNIKKPSKLYSMFGSQIDVNSNHIHNITKLAKDVVVTALSEDNVIEAIEVLDKKYIVGVEWHPEHLLKKNNTWLKIFTSFINSCK